jgi:hypothetical protein
MLVTEYPVEVTVPVEKRDPDAGEHAVVGVTDDVTEGTGLTVTTDTAVQPVEVSVNVIFAVPDETPPTTPEADTVATPTALLLHVPAPVASLNVVVAPAHIVPVPDIVPAPATIVCVPDAAAVPE